MRNLNSLMSNKTSPFLHLIILMLVSQRSLRNYAGLITAFVDVIHGKLVQRKCQLEVEHAIGRDIRMDDFGKISTTLLEWCQCCETVLNCVESQIDRANANKAVVLRHKKDIIHEVCFVYFISIVDFIWILFIFLGDQLKEGVENANDRK